MEKEAIEVKLKEEGEQPPTKIYNIVDQYGNQRDRIEVVAIEVTTPITVADKLKEYGIAVYRQLRVVVEKCCTDSVEIKQNVCTLIDEQIDQLKNHISSAQYLEAAINATLVVDGTGILREAKDQMIDFMVHILEEHDDEAGNLIDLTPPSNKDTGEIEEGAVVDTSTIPTKKLKEWLPIVEEVLQDSIIASFMTPERRSVATLVLNLSFPTNLRQPPILSLEQCLENYLLLLKDIEERVTA